MEGKSWIVLLWNDYFYGKQTPIQRGFPRSWSIPKSQMFGIAGIGNPQMDPDPNSAGLEYSSSCGIPGPIQSLRFSLGIARKSKEIQSWRTNSTEFIPNWPKGGKTKATTEPKPSENPDKSQNHGIAPELQMEKSKRRRHRHPPKIRLKAKIPEFRAGIQTNLRDKQIPAAQGARKIGMEGTERPRERRECSRFHLGGRRTPGKIHQNSGPRECREGVNVQPDPNKGWKFPGVVPGVGRSGRSRNSGKEKGEKFRRRIRNVGLGGKRRKIGKIIPGFVWGWGRGLGLTGIPLPEIPGIPEIFRIPESLESMNPCIH